MPKFELRTVAAGSIKNRPSHPYYALNAFAKGYVEAMFFTNGDTGDDDEDSLNKLGAEALTRDAVRAIKKDCADFEKRARKLLPLAYSLGYEEEQAGRDFWFTRQGHGSGFSMRSMFDREIYTTKSGSLCLREDFDGSEITGERVGDLAELLTTMAEASGEAYVEVSRNRIHYR